MTRVSQTLKHPLLELESGSRFRIDERIGASSFGSVWRATWLDAEQPVAIKRVRQDRMARATPEHRHHWIDALDRESRFLATLRSPHVVHAFEHGREGQGHPVLVLEVLDRCLYRHTLQARQRGHWPDVDTVLHWLGQIARGLDHIHRRGARHLDLKLQNLLLTPDGPLGRRVKIADFGTCLLLDTPEHGFLGTPGWLSPEQVIPITRATPGSVQYRTGPAADYYALGLVLFYLVTGRLPEHCSALAHELRTRRQAGRWARFETLERDWALSRTDRARFLGALGETELAAEEQSNSTWHFVMPEPPTTSPANGLAVELLDQLLRPWPADRLSGATQAMAL